MTAALDDVVARVIVAEAALAPSVHNVQPARWSVRGPWLVLLRDAARALPVGDPSGHDVRVSLGAAFEGASIAASRRGLALDDARWERAAHDAVGAATIGGFEVVAASTVAPGAAPDPLAEQVTARRSWRGRFADDAAAAGALRGLRHDDARVLLAADVPEMAAWMDEATWAFERRADYHAELWSWLRLDPRDPRYARDGLTADALVLSPLERTLARVALRPSVFGVLRRTGLGRAVVSEAAAVRSAAGFVCFCPPRAVDDYAAGRRFYRLWLEATALGLAMAPMSALADWAPTNARVVERLALAPERRVANVLRAGRCPREAPPPSPRLPLDELLVR